MKNLLFLCLLVSHICFSQGHGCENIFIITTDGYRWQELFSGADSAILFNPKYVTDTATSKYMYWANSPEKRREKLMPFTWSFIAAKGQLWGNRKFENNLSVTNPYRFSYAGYNEILTGYADRSVINNKPRLNRNSNVLTYLNSLPEYKNKVAMFGSWDLFSFIINGTKNKIPLNCGYQIVEGDSLSQIEKTVNYLQEENDNKDGIRSDILTFSLATQYIRKKHPRIIYIGFGQTDESAHHGRYDTYLSDANMFDKMLAELWSLVQGDEFYKNKTTLFITTDHGRGRKPGNWSVHGPFTKGSDETWLMQIGPNILPLGEIKTAINFNNEQYAQTIAAHLGQTFTGEHQVADPVFSLLPGDHSSVASDK